MKYASYKNLPMLAGLCTMEEAARPGLSVEECVARLKRYHYAFKRLHQIFTARITAEPVYELKMTFSLQGAPIEFNDTWVFTDDSPGIVVDVAASASSYR